MALENLNIIEPDQSDPFITDDEEIIIPPFSKSSGLASNQIPNVASLASIASMPPNVNFEEVEELYPEYLNSFIDSLEQGQEESIRDSFALKLVQEDLQNFSSYGAEILEDTVMGIEERTDKAQGAADAYVNVVKDNYLALERTAINRIKDLSLSNPDQLEIEEEIFKSPKAEDISEIVRRNLERALRIQTDMANIAEPLLFKQEGSQRPQENILESILNSIAFMIPTNLYTSADNIVDGITSLTTSPGRNLQAASRYLLFNATDEEFARDYPIALARLKEQSSYISENRYDLFQTLSTISSIYASLLGSKDEKISKINNYNSQLLYQNLSVIAGGGSEEDVSNINFMNALDIVLSLPFVAGSKLTASSISKFVGNRELANKIILRDLVSDASNPKASGGVTKISDNLVSSIEESLPKNMSPNVSAAPDIPSMPRVHVDLSIIRNARENVEKMLGNLGRVTEDELTVMVKQEIETLTNNSNKRIIPIEIFAPTVELKQGIPIIEVGLGKANGSLFKNAEEATKAAKRMGLPRYEIIDTNTKGFPQGSYIKVKHTADESNIIKAFDESEVDVKFPFLHFLRSPVSFNPLIISDFASASSFTKSRIFKEYKKIQDKFQGLSKKQRKRLDELTIYSNEKDIWLTQTSFAQKYLDNYGSLPSQKEFISYFAQKELHDLNYNVLNWAEQSTLVSKGYTSSTIRGKAVSFVDEIIKEIKDVEAPVYAGQHNRSVIYNADTNAILLGEDILVSDLKKLLDETDSVLVKTLDNINTPFDTPANYIITKRSNMNTYAMENIIQYKSGGPRAYDANFFIKQFQTKTYTNAKGDKKLIVSNPSTLIAGGSKTELKEAVQNLEKARLLAKEEADLKLDPGSKLTEKLVAELTPYSNLKEWKAAIRRREINLEHPFTIVRDKELPVADKGTSLDAAGVYDIQTTRASTKGEASGRLLMSRRGKQLYGADYNKAKIIAPLDVMQDVAENLLHTASFTNFKLSSIDRWTATYKQYLRPGSRHFYDEPIFNAGVPKELQNQAIASRAAIKRIIGQNTTDSMVWQYATRALADRLDNLGLGKTSKFVLDAQSKDPINALKGIAFDLKLGLFDLSQIFIQTQTIAAMAFLRPTDAVRFGYEGSLIRLTHINQSPEMAKFLANKSKMDTKEFIRMTDEMKKGGYLDVNGELILTDHHSSKIYGRVGGSIRQSREMLRLPFYEAERWNRAFAYRLAWDDFTKKFPTVKLQDEALAKGSTGEGRKFLAGKVDDYTVSMINSSAAAYQKGIFAVPAQFMSYQLRFMENIIPAMFGGNKRFTGPQKAKLVLSQLVLYGSAGIPFLNYLTSSLLESGALGEPGEEGSLKETGKRLLMGGAIDAAIYIGTTGKADLAFSDRAAVGQGIQSFVEDVAGWGLYEKPMAEILSGAAFSVGGEVVSDTFDALKLISAAFASEQVGITEVTPLIAKALAENVSSVSRAMRAYWILQNGTYNSQKTGKVVTRANSAEAWAALFGIPLREVADLKLLNYSVNSKKDFLKENGTIVLKLRNEALQHLQAGDKNQFRFKLKTAQGLLQVYTPEDRYAIIKWVNGQQQNKTIVKGYVDIFMDKFPMGQLPRSVD
tara:strand:- start:671 stop:5467 length:4797 start_codon:yes stop_codon:yes gene_type:complete